MPIMCVLACIFPKGKLPPGGTIMIVAPGNSCCKLLMVNDLGGDGGLGSSS